MPATLASPPAASQIVHDTVELARDALDMDMAFVADTRDGVQQYVDVTGDAASFGAAVGDGPDLDGTYCGKLLAGELDGLVTDAPRDERVASLPITRRSRIGSYVGVPVTLPDGTTYGTFCCVSHHADPSLRERDLRFMAGLARVIGQELHRDAEEAERHRAALNEAHVRALLAALEARDGYTEEHSHAVVDMALLVAQELGLPSRRLADVEAAALLHDMGKIGISDAILRKPGALSEEEWAEMRRHPEIGERIVSGMDGLSHLAEVIRAEHERWDGLGYPDGLAGERIPLIARIILVCDAYHAMTSDRPYRRALGEEAAIRELHAAAGSQLCPQSVRAALRVIDGARVAA
jgi:response regulator RpfG family c-di-GMP phosphodiesterase